MSSTATRLTHLQALEAESIFIIREVAAEFERPGMLFSGGKDSIVMLRLAEKAFAPARVPFPLVHIDTGHNFDEVMATRPARGRTRRARRRLRARGNRRGKLVEETARAPRGTGTRPFWRRLPGTNSTRSLRRAPTKRRRGRRSAPTPSVTSSASGPEEPAPGAEPLQRPPQKGEHLRIFHLNWTDGHLAVHRQRIECLDHYAHQRGLPATAC